MDLGVLEMSQGSGAEVPIPVFADVEESSIPPIASSSNVNITPARKEHSSSEPTYNSCDQTASASPCGTTDTSGHRFFAITPRFDAFIF